MNATASGRLEATLQTARVGLLHVLMGVRSSPASCAPITTRLGTGPSTPPRQVVCGVRRLPDRR